MQSRVQINLPTHYPKIKNSKFSEQKIKRRLPWYMPGELVVPASSELVFATNTFISALEYPMEITGFVPFMTTLDSSGNPQDDPGIGSLRSIYRYGLLSMKMIGGPPFYLTQAKQRLSSLMTLGGDVPFDAPVYLENGQGFWISMENQMTAAMAAGGVRFELSFQGSYLEIE